MTTINLLPWREALRKEKQQQFFIALGASALVAVISVGGVHLTVDNMIEVQNSRNSFLQAQIDRVERQIVEINALEKEKQNLLARMAVIQDLQQGRSQMVHIFDEIAKVVPEGLFITRLEQKAKVVTLTGVAQSNARVSSLMRNLEGSEWFEDAKLEEIVSDKNATVPTESRFKLQVKLSGLAIEEAPKEQPKKAGSKSAKKSTKKEKK